MDRTRIKPQLFRTYNDQIDSTYSIHPDLYSKSSNSRTRTTHHTPCIARTGTRNHPCLLFCSSPETGHHSPRNRATIFKQYKALRPPPSPYHPRKMQRQQVWGSMRLSHLIYTTATTHRYELITYLLTLGCNRSYAV